MFGPQLFFGAGIEGNSVTEDGKLVSQKGSLLLCCRTSLLWKRFAG